MSKPTEEQTRIILDSIADGVFTVDANWRITAFNRAAENITGIKRREAIGRHCWEVFKASICEQCCSLRQTMQTGQSIVNFPIFIVTAKGDRIPVSISTALLRDRQGRVIGGVETFRDLSELEQLRKELSAKHSFYDIISKNREMQRLFGMLERVAESNTTVLLEGESGTGKELFARAIHSLSPRRDGPLVVVQCGALPDTLLESELFGYKAGAFTDAKQDKPGRLAMAEGGTLFLDEIGDISPTLQLRLLRFLQERVYEPLGGTRPQKADVRVVAATNKNLDRLVAEGSFRQDLYYRVHVVKLSLPPLRARKEDIPLLVEHFLRKFNRLQGRSIEGTEPEVLPVLMAHDYPGNVRELENIIEYATVVCRQRFIALSDLPDNLRPRGGAARDSESSAAEGPPPALADLEKQLILRLLKQNRFNRKATAEALGVHPTTLWRKIKRLKLHIPDPSRGGRRTSAD